MVAQLFRLQLPVSLVMQSFSLKMELICRAFKDGEMGGRDVCVSVAEMANGKPELFEMASMMLEPVKDGAAVLREFQENGGIVSNVPKCWTKPLPPSHDLAFDIKEILPSNDISNALSLLDSSGTNIVYRLTNRPTYEPAVAMLMWQHDNSHQKYWLNCLTRSTDLLTLAKALLEKGKHIHDPCNFTRAAVSTFGTDCSNLSPIPAQKGKNTNVAQKIASIQRRPSCLASRRRVIINDKDFDLCFLFHAALELDVLSDFMSDEQRAKKGNAILAK